MEREKRVERKWNKERKLREGKKGEKVDEGFCPKIYSPKTVPADLH